MKSNPYKSKKYDLRNKYIKKAGTGHKIRLPKFSMKALFINMFKKKRRHARSELIYNKEIYVGSIKKNNYPAWLLPLLVVLGITMVVFWMGPLILNSMAKMLSRPDDENQNKNLRYASADYSIVSVQAADIYDKPDLKATRKTQVLYNQVVRILDRSTYGFYEIELDDRTKGYIMSENTTSYTECAEPSLFKFRIVIVSKSKKIMTHSSNGSTIVELMMGTVLYSNYQGDDVYKVSLPNKSEGWISANGVLKLDSTEEIQKSNAKSFYTTVLSFNDATYINQGLTKNGASSEGIAYIAAKVNGRIIPRDKQGQSESGTKVEVLYDKESGKLNYDAFQAGDLIFFKSVQNPAKVGETGIIIGYGQVLISRSSIASVKIINLDDEPNLAASVLAVRRIF